MEIVLLAASLHVSVEGDMAALALSLAVRICYLREDVQHHHPRSCISLHQETTFV